MTEATQLAFRRFEDKLAERSEPGRQLGSARALFDLWIDAAEEAYAEIALSPKFREVYGDYVNSQMRVRAAVQQEIEEMCGLFGIPGRTEIDATHRKIVQLEREVRRLRDALEHPGEPKSAAPGKVVRAQAASATPESKAKPPAAQRATSKSAPAAPVANATLKSKPASKPKKSAAVPAKRASTTTTKRKR